jgi:hypothetical protein
MNDFDFDSGWSDSPSKKLGKNANEAPMLAISDCDSTGEVSSLTEKIAVLWEQRVSQLVLDFLDINEMRPNPALLIYDLLQRKPPGTKIVANAHSPIIGPGFLVWLAADHRYIRSTAWIYIRPPNSEGRRRPCPPWMEEMESWRQEATSVPDFIEMDYRTVLRLINKYLPVKALAGKPLTPALLDEFCLLGPRSNEPTRTIHRDKPIGAGHLLGPLPQSGNLVQCGKECGGSQQKMVWFIERKENGRYTLKGGYPPSMMLDDPALRQKSIRIDFATKDDLLRHLDEIAFCVEKDKVVMDGDEIVRGK